MRFTIATGISEYWGHAAVPRLIELLEDKDEWVREEAARGLWNNPDKSAAQALVRHLHETSMYIASHCACALADIADPATISGLLDAMRDKNVLIAARVHAAGALARMKNREGLAFLKAQIHSTDKEARQTVVDALGPKVTGSLEMLQSMLDDEDSLTKMRALLSIEEFGKAVCVPAAQKLQSDPDKDVRECARNVLKRLHVDFAPESQPAEGDED
jgi:HEAT repeat protein